MIFLKRRLFFSISLLFAFCSITVTRLFLIAFSSGEGLKNAAFSQQTSSVIYYTSRAVITDCNGAFLTDSESSLLGVVSLPEYSGGVTFEEKYNDYFNSCAKNRTVAILPVLSAEKNARGVFSFKTLTRYSKNQLATHLIGSLNENGDGVSGLEYAFNSFFRKNEKKFTVSYLSNSLGYLISGKTVSVSGDATPSADRLILTIDERFQKIAEEASKSIKSGAVIVTDVKTGEIKAMVSKPYYHPYEMGDALETEGALVNKCLNAFNAGSAFKLLTLCAFLENGNSEFHYECDGVCELDNLSIGCYRQKSHGILDIPSALSASCNGFFIMMGIKNGASSLFENGKAFGFGEKTPLAENFYSSAGYFPTLEELKKDYELANVSMGQGKLLVTPVQIASLTQTIANGGIKKPLSVVLGKTENGVFTEDSVHAAPESRIISEKTAAYVANCMREVSLNGTGKKANPSCGSGTKTSTAETGIINENGKNVIQSWITGFFPSEAPAYTITVLVENTDPTVTNTSPVFKEIAEKISALS